MDLRSIFIRETHLDGNLPNSREHLLSGKKQSDSINISKILCYHFLKKEWRNEFLLA